MRPEPTLLRKLWIELWAFAASDTVLSWKIYKTATRAKSTISSVTTKVEVGIAAVLVPLGILVIVVVGGADVVVGADDVGEGVGDDDCFVLVMVVANTVEPDNEVDSVSVLMTKLPENEPVHAGLSTVRVMSTSGRTLRVIGTAAATTAAAWSRFESLRSDTSAEPSSVRRDCPLNVTNAFSVLQERFSLLNFDCINVATRGIEKLAWASFIRRGIACPMVTLLILDSAVMIDVVVQPCEVGIVQSTPVNPLEQIHEQDPWRTTFVPPLAQVSSASQVSIAGCATF